MVSGRPWIVAALIVGFGVEVRAQLAPLLPPAISPANSSEGVLPDPIAEPPIAGGVTLPDAPIVEAPFIDKPAESEPWVAPPAPAEHWISQVDFIATTFHATAGPFGGFSEDPSFSLRSAVGYEFEDGLGIRTQAWWLTDRIRTGFGTIDVDAATVYFDGYYEHGMKDLELRFGGGLAGSYMDFVGRDYVGLGASIFADGYYPLRRTPKSDIGLIGRGRLAVLGSIEDELMEGWGSTIDEFIYGLRYRRHVGCSGNYWSLDLAREAQHWSSTSDPFASDQVFRGTALNFGYAW